MEHEPGGERADDLLNPNLSDVPEQPSGSGRELASVGNVFWSDRANSEHLLRQMRPDHLPQPEQERETWEMRLGMFSERTADEHSGSMGTEALFTTAREMDRQTSVGRFQPLDALLFLVETERGVRTEPEYYNLAEGEGEAGPEAVLENQRDEFEA